MFSEVEIVIIRAVSFLILVPEITIEVVVHLHNNKNVFKFENLKNIAYVVNTRSKPLNAWSLDVNTTPRSLNLII